MTQQISIIGQGAFGRALSSVYSAAGFSVSSFGRDFPATPPGQFVFLAIPTLALGDVARRLRLSTDQIAILCCKGILPDGQLPSSSLAPDQAFAILSGPGFADELARGLPTVHSIAAQHGRGKALAHVLSTENFRLYWSDDPIGTQICGAYKNILAIAAGITEGLGLGENARAALLARGAAELRHIIARFGGDGDTIWSPAGLGDLSLTCNSAKSRNFRFGKLLAQGHAADQAETTLGTVEGLSALRGLSGAGLDQHMPITHALQEIVAETISPIEALRLLMKRPIRQG